MSFIFDVVGWQPIFCESFVSIDLKADSSCRMNLSRVLTPLDTLGFENTGMLYVNGDDQTDDYKVLYIIGKNVSESEFVVTKLTIWDERE